jgi:AraC-like DNA-binding protein
MSLGHSVLFTVLLYGNFSSIYFLIGPVLYFYFRSLRQGNSTFYWSDLWHLIPFLVVFVDTIPYYLSPYVYKVEVVRQVFSNWTAMFSIQLGAIFSAAHLYILRPLLLTFYTIWGLMYLKKNKLYFFNATKLGKWLLVFLVLQWLIYVGMSSVFLGVWLENTWHYSFLNHPSEIKYISLVAYVLMVCTLYFFPEVIYLNMDRFKRDLNPQEVFWWKMDQKLNDMYIFDKPFLKPFLTLDQLGELVQMDKAVLIDFFELYLFTNFTDEMNRLRIQFAKNLIAQAEFQMESIDNLYKESGFESQAALVYCFSEFEGENLGDYVQNFKNN